MRRILVVFSLLLLSLLALLPVIAQDEGAAYVRVAHLSPDAPAVDVYIDGTVAIPALAFPTITDFVQLTAGSHEIVVAPAGTSIEDAAIGPAEITFAPDSWTTIAAIGSLANGTLAPVILTDDFSATDGQARVTVFHAIEGAPAVDVLAGGEAVITRLGYPSTIGANDGAFTIEVDPGTYDISVTANGDATAELLSAPGTVLEADNVYFIAAVGTADSPQLAVASFNPLSVVQGPAPEETAEATAEVTAEATAEATPEVTEEPPGTIIDEATAAGNFTTLLAAIEAAGLTETLSGEGTFTVFAPTDEAFAALLDEMGVAAEDVMADTDLLTSILLYHVTDNQLSGTQVATLDGFAIGTLNGEPISVTVNEEGGVVLNDTVNVVTTDIPASNGVIHVIDAVLLPPTGDVTGDDQSIAQGNLIDVATEAGDFTTLIAAIEAAGLTDTLANGGPFTIFAPSDIAFDVLLDELGLTAEELLADTELLTTVLTYHVVEGEVFSADLEDGDLTTLNGAVITLDVTDGGNVFVNEAMVAVTDLTASNGVIHVIDGVLLPPMPEATAEATAEATPEVTEEPPGTIIDEATAAGNFTTLLAAIEAADLTETLSGEGTFTVFAPTDEAFAVFLDEQGMTEEELLADTELLTSILQYHVTDVAISGTQVAALDRFAIGTLADASIRVSVNEDGDVVLNDMANVVTTDIAASNGVIHVIDAVMSPEDGGRGRR